MSQSAALPDPGLREILKRCSLPTYDAARAFRLTGNPRYLRSIILGVLEPHVGSDLRSKLGGGGEELRLEEDLGIDSLSRIEIASVLEDATGFSFDFEELRPIRTLGELEQALAAKARLG